MADSLDSENIIYLSNDKDDDDSSNCSTNYNLYRTRHEWADIQPMSIRSESSILDIKYSVRFEDAFSYLRAIMVKDELSERALELTSDCIELQITNFTVWYFRRRILKKLPHLATDELSYVEKLIEDSPKNYQVWHHRATIVEWFKDSSHEKALTSLVIDSDSKNYHAWQHRQWVIKTFKLWEGELDFTTKHLTMDPKNNSAWNHRYYVIKETEYHADKNNFEEEKSFVLEKIKQVPNNESSWSYLRGLLRLVYNNISSDKEVIDFSESLADSTSIHALSFLIDAIYEKLTSPTFTKQDNQPSDLKSRGLKLCDQACKIDNIRIKYWTYKRQTLDLIN